NGFEAGVAFVQAANSDCISTHALRIRVTKRLAIFFAGFGIRRLSGKLYSRIAAFFAVNRAFILRVSNHTRYLILALLVLGSAFTGIAVSWTSFGQQFDKYAYD